MSARRAARFIAASSPAADGPPPACLQIGPCIEVWAEPGEWGAWTARIRWHAARSAWMAEHGISDFDSWRVIPAGAPWSLADHVSGRLSQADCTEADLPALRAAANRLTQAVGADE